MCFTFALLKTIQLKLFNSIQLYSFHYSFLIIVFNSHWINSERYTKTLTHTHTHTLHSGKPIFFFKHTAVLVFPSPSLVMLFKVVQFPSLVISEEVVNLRHRERESLFHLRVVKQARRCHGG